MDLIHKEHITRLEAGQDGRHIAGAFHGRTGGDPDGDAHLFGDDIGQGGLTQAWRAVDDHVVQGFFTDLGGLHGYGEVVLGVGLADKVFQPLGTQGYILVLLLEIAGN